jgi:hypothetical protein
VRAQTELALARIGGEILTGALVDEFLATSRTRYTGGLDGALALRARDELGADAVLVTTVGRWREQAPASVQVSMRMVSADETPKILWFEAAERGGDDTVGLLGLGGVARASDLLPTVIGELRESLRRRVNGGRHLTRACDPEARFEPQTAHRFPGLDLSRSRRVAVLPFEDHTGRRGAGELVALEFARGLGALPTAKLVDPGLVRTLMLGNRFVMVDGVSIELGDMLWSTDQVELVVTGRVDAYDEGAPEQEFSVTVLDTRLHQVVWRSRSRHRGDDGVVFFDAGRVRGAGALTCRMVAPIVRALGREAPRARSLASVGDYARVAQP